MSASAVRRARKLALVKTYLGRRPVWCSWQLTRRCAAACHLCEHRSEGAELELDTASARRMVEQLDTLGTLIVSLTGGDPLLRDDLPEIVGSLARHHFPLLTTHGFLVTTERARALWSHGLEAASVVLHDADPARHDARFGLPGAHQQALRALRALVSTRTGDFQRVNVKTSVQQSEASLLGLLELAEREGASLTLEGGFPLPLESEPDSSGGSPSRREAPERPLPGRRLLEIRRQHPALRSSSFFLDRLDAALADGIPGCQAGKAFFNLDHRGRASKCIEYVGGEHVLGVPLHEGFGGGLAQRLRDVPQGNACRACWQGSRGEVERLYTLRGLASGLPELVRA